MQSLVHERTYVTSIKVQTDLVSTIQSTVLGLRLILKVASPRQWLVDHGLVPCYLAIFQTNSDAKRQFRWDPSSGAWPVLLEATVFAKYNRVLGSIIVCASQNIAMLIVGRIINGLAVGVSLQDPIILQQCLTTQYRFAQPRSQSISLN